jgi:uridine kinase
MPERALQCSGVDPLCIGIAGGTASGKTTVARKIVERLGSEVAFLDQDSYYRDLPDLSIDELRDYNWDHPDAFDIDLIVEQLRALKAGRAVEKPVYSFTTYQREKRSERIAAAPLVVIEGILVLGIEAVRRELDVKIYVDAEDDVRILRRLERDLKERGRDFDSVVRQYFRHVRPMHYGFVEPSKRHADVIIPHGGNNEVAIDMVAGALRARGAGRAMS